MPDQQRKRAKAATRSSTRKAGASGNIRKADAAIAAAMPCVVGVGASAGGFEAIRKLLSMVPTTGNLAFVVVQHLDPRHKSMAAELLAPRTALTVVDAVDGRSIVADHVYIVPAASEVAVVDNRLQLTPRIETERPHLPVDRLFHALADSLKERAIGIVLSGTGSDGSLGALKIVAEGGIVLVQEPSTARYDGMPRSVIASGAASQVLTLEAMPEVLIGYSRHPYVHGDADAPASESAIEEAAQRMILAALRRSRGSLEGYKPATLLRRIRRRMGLRRITDLAEYAQLIGRDEAEAGALYKDMLIGVTGFFRDPDAWSALARDVILPLVRDKADTDPIRVWVAGAATGEEAYTVAMLLMEAKKALGKDFPIRVFATDVNPESVAFARLGRYLPGIATQVSPERLKAFFLPDAKDNAYQVRPELRECVTFGVQDLTNDPPFSRMHLICCRNVLIYLRPAVQGDLMRVFDFALEPRGYLFLGMAESVREGDGRFLCRSQKWKIYQRMADTGTQRARPPDGRLQGRQNPDPLPPVAGPGRTAAFPDLVHRLLLERFAAAAAVVDGHHQILYFAGATDRFLGPPKGPPTQDILALARDGLRSRLRNALTVAAEKGTEVRIDDARIRHGRQYRPVHITVMPVEDPVASSYGRLFIVVFADEPAVTPVLRRPSATVRRLEDELQLTRDDLESTIDDLQASNLELKFSNEAVTAANEELQALNEELESSKEELQSLNEELQTSNQQLADKVAELATANSDLQNLFHSSDIGTIRLDSEMNIRWFTPAATVAMSLRPYDIGRPITDLASALGGTPLLDQARAVLGKLTAAQDEVQASDGRWFMRRILPYRVENGRVDGVIITLTDITETKRSAAAALAEKEVFAATLEKRVEERTRELGEMASALSLAEDKERQAIAADLHDDLAQVLSLIKLKLQLAGRRESAGPAPGALDEISRLIDSADARVRALATQLSNPVLHQLGLMAALEALSDEMRRDYHLEVELHDDGVAKPLEPPVSIIVYRAVRELLINVAKHAGTTRTQLHCAVDTHKDGQTLVVVVRDDGRGFVPEDLNTARMKNRGFGLRLIRERLRFIGGSFDIASKPGDGAEATIIAPLQLSTRHGAISG